MADSQEFKTCPCCGHKWKSREEFIHDVELVINGYQADFESLEKGLFLFTHEKSKCGTTMSVEVEKFNDIYQGPRYKERNTGSNTCPGYCMELHNLNRCSEKCECAYVREILDILHNKKNLIVSK